MPLRLLLLLGSLTLGTLTAQDLHWSKPQWIAADDAPDQLPVTRSLRVPPLPATLKEHNGYQYAEARVFVPARGRPTVFSGGLSTPWLYDELYSVVREGRFDPAQRDGKAVPSEILVHLIFNPAEASASAPNALPRLLDVVPPAYPMRNDKAPANDFVAAARLQVDEKGAVTEVAPLTDDKELAQAMISAVQRWRFAPARKDGQPVAAEILVPVLFNPPQQNEATGTVQPKVVKQVPPIYPMGMRIANISGQVLVSFVVTVEGRVADAFVIRSTNDGFDDAALAAVRSWRFQPGELQGRLVNTRMQVPIIFTIEGEKLLKVRRPRKFPDDLPEALRFDVPPEINDLVLPYYPVEALEKRQNGRVRVGFVVNPQGSVSQSRIIGEPPSPEIAGAARAAVESFRFIPPAKDGHPSHALLSIELEFDHAGTRGHVPVSHDVFRALRLLSAPEKLPRLNQLDAVPKPRAQPAPIRPTALPADVRAEVLIEFLIDRQGIARLPRIVQASHEAAGPAAALAISRWRYEPPRQAGQPVDVLARIPVVFQPVQ
jgi:TonB family protein